MLTHKRSSSEKSPPPESVSLLDSVHVSSKKKNSSSGQSSGGIFRGLHSHQGNDDSHSDSATANNQASELLRSTTSTNNKSLLSSLARPLFSSTPIGGGGGAQGIFHHNKRRSSSGLDQAASGGKTPSDSEPKRFPRWSVSHRNPLDPDNQGGGIFNRFRSNTKHVKSGIAPVLVNEQSLLGNRELHEIPITAKESSPEEDTLVSVLEDLNNEEVKNEGPSNFEKPNEYDRDDAWTISHQPHSSDERDLRSMETSLLSLLQDFQSGKLNAFGGGTMEKMKNVREQQEMLAKLHFHLYEEECKLSASHKDSTMMIERNLGLLSKGLEDLSESVETLGWEERILINRPDY